MIQRYFFSLFAAALMIFVFGSPEAAEARVADWQQGVSIVSRWGDDFSSPSFRQSVDNARSVGVNYITLIIIWNQSDLYATAFHRGNGTPNDQALIDAIQYIHSLGLRVHIKMHVDLDTGEWRGFINPGDRDAWFRNYGDVLARYAGIARDQGVDMFTIGTEMVEMTSDDAHPTNTSQWRALIQEVRSVYGGILSYSGNWGSPGWADEKNRISFWDALDVIGVSAYYPLPTNNPSVESFRHEWNQFPRSDIDQLHARWQKPVVFTEIGYRSTDWAHYAPFDPHGGGRFDEQNQANLYEALFSYWDSVGYMNGVHLWDWSSDPSSGGPGNISFTPQGKMAIGRMQQWFGEAPLASTSRLEAISVRGATAYEVATVGTPISFTVWVDNGGDVALNDGIVNIEVQTSSGGKVHQQFFEHEMVSAHGTQAYTASWTPQEPGRYRVHVGIFSANWQAMHTWAPAIIDIDVSSSASASDPVIDIWWPPNGSVQTGVQPLKAVVSFRPLDTYHMFWQVDGDRLNPMGDSFAEFAHKEAYINFSEWVWRGSGPYSVTLIAKSHDGQEIARGDIQVQTQ